MAETRWSGYPRPEYDATRRAREREAQGIARRPGFLAALLAVLGIMVVLGVFLASVLDREADTPAGTPIAEAAEKTPVAKAPATKPIADTPDLARASVDTPTASPAAEAPLAASAAPIDNPIGKQAMEMGVTDCLPRIVALSDFLTRDADTQWLATGGPQDRNKELFVAAIATRQRDGGLKGIAMLNAAPVGEGRCNTSYSSTTYFAQSCIVTHATAFRAFYNRINFGSDFVQAYANGDGSGRLFLFPAGEGGCVAVMTEAFY